MQTDIYLNPKFSKKDGWTSFESDPHLRNTKKAIHQRCLPCIKNLYQQLIQGEKSIELGTAFDCWKVVVVMETVEECLDILEIYRDRFLIDRHIRGRYGGKNASSTQAIVVMAENELDRDNLVAQMNSCLTTIGLKRTVFYSKGCADPYEKILGPWKIWQQKAPIRHDKNIKSVINNLDQLLRRV